MRIQSLFIYPVKSCAPLVCDQLHFDAAGPLFDREWMVIDADGRFLSQREEPRMALVKTALTERELILSAAGKELRVPLASPGSELVQATVWNDTVPAHVEDAAFLTAFLGRQLRLVRISRAGRVTGSPDDRRPVRFADSSAVNFLNLASLADLNTRLKEPVEPLRFRPNVVLEGGEAWGEDKWKFLRAGGFEFKSRKPTTRCSITSVDLATGVRKGPEPLKTLASFRRNANNGIEFAQHFYSCDGAELRVGMEVSAEF